MHSGAVLFSWSCAVIALQALAGTPLTVLAVLLPWVFGSAERRRWIHLARRSRWLLLVLATTFIFSTPGESFIPGWPGSWEGLWSAAEHCLRFLLVLAAVAWLLTGQDRDQLIAGMFCLSRPLAVFGVRRERAIVRLALIFDHFDREPPAADWRTLLEDDQTPPTRVFEFALPELRANDLALSALALALLVFAALA